MFSQPRLASALLVLGSGTLLGLTGCLSAAAQRVEWLLAPEAAANLITAPYSSMTELLDYVAQAF